ncbi:MAG: Ni/Fe-hydrogenase, b-type cytochrome subunit [Planctomycetota bacterium]
MSQSIAQATESAAAETSRPRYERVLVWERPVRIFHWVNAAAIIVLFFTGLYIANPILASTGEPWNNFLMARIRQIHFAAAFIFLIAFLVRCYWFWVGNEHARSGFPYVWRKSWWKDLWKQALAYNRFDFGHPHLGHNALAGLSYTIFVIGLGWLQIFTGLAMYSESDPDGFWGRTIGWVIPLFGGSFRTHMWHHLFAWMFIWFAIVHVYIVLLDSRMYRNGLIGSMITGMKFRRERTRRDAD